MLSRRSPKVCSGLIWNLNELLQLLDNLSQPSGNDTHRQPSNLLLALPAHPEARVLLTVSQSPGCHLEVETWSKGVEARVPGWTETVTTLSRRSRCDNGASVHAGLELRWHKITNAAERASTTAIGGVY